MYFINISTCKNIKNNLLAFSMRLCQEIMNLSEASFKLIEVGTQAVGQMACVQVQPA